MVATLDQLIGQQRDTVESCATRVLDHRALSLEGYLGFVIPGAVKHDILVPPDELTHIEGVEGRSIA